MSPEAILAGGYAVFLLAAAMTIEWLSAHTHRRSLRYRTAGFEYDAANDVWHCPEGQDLWPHDFDHERRLVRYRAKAHVCNGCPRKAACTDSEHGREVVRPLDGWPHSEAGRFHRGLSLLLVALAVFTVLVAGARHHAPPEAGVLLGVLAIAGLAARWLARDFLTHPSGFPEPTAAQGLGFGVAAADGRRPRSRWASQNRTKG
jgi:Transposase DDE domain